MRVLFLAFVALLAPGFACAQTFPIGERPIRIIVPFPPGGTVDIVARTLAQRLGEQMKQTVIVENRAGANGTIGSDYVSKAAPDGHTLLVQASIFVINPLILPKTPYDVQKDFAPIANIGNVPLIVSAHPSVPASNLREFVELSKKSPERFTFATSGLGSAGHLSEELIKLRAGLSILIVPYKGAGPALQDLLGGQVSSMIDPFPSSYPHVRSGKLKALAVTGRARASFMSEVATVAEQGFPGFDVVSWYGIWGPPTLSREVINRLATETTQAVRSKELNERLAPQGFEPTGSTPEQFAAYVRDEIAKYAKIVRDANIKVEP
ncbi:MAG: tripartite tricarboxylate transporter substrate binding protein [Burkholderiales bacterium]